MLADMGKQQSQCDHSADDSFALLRKLLPNGSPSLFHLLTAGRDVLRYSEVERLYNVVRELRREDDTFTLQSRWDDDGVLNHKHTDEPLTHGQVWDKAINAVLDVLDEELGRLSGS